MDIYTATEEAYKKGYAKGKEDAEKKLVRCKDCKHRKKYVYPFSDQTYTKCEKWPGIPRPDDFCSYGERKDNE